MLGKSYRWCDKCGRKSVIFTLKEHVNTKKRIYKCNICNTTYLLNDRKDLIPVMVGNKI